MKFLKKNSWLLVLLVAFAVLDLVVGAVFQPYLIRSGRFLLNDFELTRRDHPEQVWDKVFFGNSVVISAYREDVSQSGYVNLGLDYGVVRDLWEMLLPYLEEHDISFFRVKGHVNLNHPATDVKKLYDKFCQWNGRDFTMEDFRHITEMNNLADKLVNDGIDSIR